MAFNPPNRNEAFSFRLSLDDASIPGRAKTNPTLAVGDVKIDKDGAGLNNITTLPTVSPAGSSLVLVSLSASEMDADVVSVVFADQTATIEWCDSTVCIVTTAA